MKKQKKNLKVANRVGKMGEDMACMFLMKRGFKVLERNYLKRWGEIDIVAYRSGKILFVEVKSVSCETLADVSHETPGYRPEENIHEKKLKSLGRVIQSYLIEHKAQDGEWSFAAMVVRVCEAQKIARVRFMPDIVL